MDKITVPISKEPVTGFTRVAHHENFVIGPDLNMVQQIRVVTLNKQGKPILENLEALSPEQRQNALERYRDQLTTRTTTGAFVDIAGTPLEPSKTGDYPEGAIMQRTFIQGITLGDMEDAGLPISRATSVASLLYALIGQEIVKLDKRAVL